MHQPGRLVRLLDPVVAAARGAHLLMLHAGQFGRPRERGSVAAQPIRGDLGRRGLAGPGEQAPEESLGGRGVSLLSQVDVERLAVLVDRAPESLQVAAHPDSHLVEHLVEMPRAARVYFAPPEFLGVQCAELRDPAAHRLIAHLDAALFEQLLDILDAECVAEVAPDGVRDDLRREAVSTA
jgi:hypothetical protein